MPAVISALALSGQPPPKRLKLSMPSLDRQPADWQGSEPQSSYPAKEEGSTTPRRPSYSPVTPTISHTSLVSGDHSTTPAPEWIDEPEPLPVSLEENADAIALRAAISILQLQRQQSLRDIRALDRMKVAALDDPETFVADLQAGKLTKPGPVGILNIDDSDDDTADDTKARKGPENAFDASVSHFGQFPNAQNVVRSPPINWDKYHVVGESLDRLHAQQQKRPGSDYSADEQSRVQPGHAIATPYRPFVDKLGPSPATPTQRGRGT